MKLCSVPGCGRKVRARQLCRTHYEWDRLGIPFDKPIKIRYNGARCERPGCTAPAKVNSMCNTHNSRAARGAALDAEIVSRVPADMSVEDRLLHYREIDSNGCWLFTGGLTDGYGCLQVSRERIRTAHVWSWTLTNGPVPEGLYVLHKCHVRRCFNVDHLYVGTHADNMRDKVEAGRLSRFPGSSNPSAKYSEETVLAVFHDPRPGTVIAAEYGMSRSTVSAIKTGRQWGSVTGKVFRGSA